MNKTSLLMPHTCQKAGWCLLILSVLAELVKVRLIHDINLYLGELLLLVLPILLCVLYYGLFKRMLWQSRKEEAR